MVPRLGVSCWVGEGEKTDVLASLWGAQLKGITQDLGGLSWSCPANTDQPAGVHSLCFIEVLSGHSFLPPFPLSSLLPFSALLTLPQPPPSATKNIAKRWEMTDWFRSPQFLPASSNVPIVSSMFLSLHWFSPQQTSHSLMWNPPASLEGN